MEGPKRIQIENLAAQLESINGLTSGVISIVDKDLSAPPPSPTVGARYIVGAAATGAWATHEEDIAQWSGISWSFTSPIDATVYIADEDAVYHYISGVWTKIWDATIAAAAQAALTGAQTAQGLAEDARDDAIAAEAFIATIITGPLSGQMAYFPAAQSDLPRGATGHGAITGGSGGTNGTFALAFSGGNFSSNPTGTFTVSGGAVTSVDLTSPGLYVGASPTAPTLDFSASTGLTGASCALTVDYLVGNGEYYWTDDATVTSVWRLYKRNGTSPSVTDYTMLTDAVDTIDEYKMTLGSSFSTYKVTEDTGSVLPAIYESVNFTNLESYEFLVVAKKDERSRLNMICTTGAIFNCTFDLTAEECTSNLATVIPSITALGNGFFLCMVEVDATATTSGNAQARIFPDTGSSSYTGDGASGLYIDSMIIRVAGTTTNLFSSSNPSAASFTKASGVLSVTVATLSQSTGGGLIEALNRRVFGEMTADEFVEGSGSISPSCYKSVSFASGTAYRLEVEAKANTREIINLFSNAGAIFNCTFNLKTGGVSASGASSPTASIEYISNGWYRCIVEVTATASSSSNVQLRVFDAGQAHPYTGDGVSSIYVNKATISVDGVNIFENTDDFGVAYWTKAGLTINSNAALFGGITDGLSAPARPYSGKKWAALGTSITIGGKYTGPLTTLLGATLTNLGVSGGSIGEATNGHAGSLAIYNAIASIPSDADLVTIEAGINDFGSAWVNRGTIGDTTTATFCGGLRAAVVAIRVQAPNAKIVFLTPYSGGSGTATHRHFVANGNGDYLYQFQDDVEDVARLTGCPVIDVGRQSGIGYDTASLYMPVDGLHLDATGGGRYANYVFKQLSILAEAGMLGA
jgi:lysophospholipase L1-like esterase